MCVGEHRHHRAQLGEALAQRRNAGSGGGRIQRRAASLGAHCRNVGGDARAEGEVVVVEADSKKYTELKRDDVLKGKVWSYPVLAYNHLFARSTEEGVCIQFQ